jgi:putative aminopeptidase FrvX
VPDNHLKTLRTVVDLPTAPFVEGHVAAFIRRFVARRPGLRLRSDQFGNLLVKYTPRRKAKCRLIGRPILFAAHMDHPGFIAERMIDETRLYAAWRGGVQSRYFPGAKIKFYSAGRWIPAEIEKVILPKTSKALKRATAKARSASADNPPKAVIARVKKPVAIGSPGMWAISDAVFRGHRLYCRASDDLSGVAAILCALDDIVRQGLRCPCFAFFTRAEEVGFGGALAAVDSRTIPRSVTVVAVENSKAIPGVTLGDGPVLRVGDKASVFTPAATSYCQVVAEKLAQQEKRFRFQRKLMDGGTCESTAYCHHGYGATGICLPLVNYHNMDVEARKIAPEAIDVRDFQNLVRWFVALAESPLRLKYDGGHPTLTKRLDALLKRHRPRLLKTRLHAT